MRHELKTWQRFMPDIANNLKTFELRKDDRGFAVGDELQLMGYDNADDDYTGDEIIAEVTYKLDSWHDIIQPGYCILGIRVKYHNM